MEPTDLNSLILSERSKRLGNSQPVKAADDALAAMLAEEQAAAASAAASPAAPAVAPPAAPKEDWSVAGEAYKAVTSGAFKAIKNTVQTIDDAATWLDNNVIDLRTSSSTFGQIQIGRQPTLSAIVAGTEGGKHKATLTKDTGLDALAPAAPVTMGGKIGEGLMQFLTGYAGAARMVAVKGFKGAMVKGAVADGAAFDPHEARMSNLAVEFGKGNPVIDNMVTQYLRADPSDGAMEGRLKNVLEGAGMGLAVEGVFRSIKHLRDHFRAKGMDPAEAAQKAADEFRKANPEEALEQAESLGTIHVNSRGDAVVGETDPGLAEAMKRANTPAVPQPRATNRPTTESPGTISVGSGGIAHTPSMHPADLGPLRPDVDPRLDAGTQEAARRAYAAQEAAEAADPGLRVIRELDGAVEAVEARTARRAWINPEDGTVSFTRARPEGVALDFDRQVTSALERAPEARTQADLTVLRAYAEVQEAALSRFKEGFSVDRSAGRPRTPEADASMRAAAAPPAPAGETSHAVKQMITEQAEELLEQIGKQAQELSGLVDAAGKRFSMAPGMARPLGRGPKLVTDQRGFVSPTILANLASGAAGATIGAANAGDDATAAERLHAAGLGALAGLGVKSVVARAGQGVAKMAEGRAKTAAATAEIAAKQARPETIGIQGTPQALASKFKREKVLPKIGTEQADTAFAALTRNADEGVAELENLGFNFANIDAEHEVMEMMNTFQQVFAPQVAKAKRGRKTLEDTAELGRLIGAKDGESVSRNLGELFKDTSDLDSRVFAARNFVLASAAKTRQAVNFATANINDPEALLAARKQMMVHAMVQARMNGVQTEIARALGAMRLTASAQFARRAEVDQLVNALGGPAANKDLIEVIGKLSPEATGEFNAAIRATADPRSQSKLLELFYNSILSGPQTHIVNALGNSLLAAASLGEKALASGIGRARSWVTGDTDYVRVGEVAATVDGWIGGLKDVMHINATGRGELLEASRLFASGRIREAEELVAASSNMGNAYKAFTTDRPLLDGMTTSGEALTEQGAAISARGFDLEPSSMLGMTADYAGAILRSGASRLLTTSDEVFKTALYRGELKSQALRKASMEGLDGDAMLARAADLLTDPTPEIHEAAMLAARKGTFTQPLGVAGQKFTSAIRHYPVVSLVVPFIRTPLNILKYVGERTPLLNRFSANVKAEYEAGGARADIMRAKTAFGTSMFMMAGWLASQGYIIGGGDKQQQAEKIGGQMPYSIKIGDKFYAFNRADPFGMFLGIAADVADLSGQVGEAEMGELTGAAMLAFNRNLTARSYVKGMMDFFTMMGDTDRYGERFVQRFVSSFVPSLLATTAREMDPVQREVNTVWEAIKSRVPGYSKDLPAQLNVLGEEIKWPPGWGPDMLSPIRVMELSKSPLSQEILRLNADVKSPGLSIPVGEIGRIDIDSKQHHRLMKLTGEFFKREGEKLVSSAKYQRLPEPAEGTPSTFDTPKGKAIEKVWQAALAQGRAKLVQEDETLRQQMTDMRRQQGNVFLGKPIN